jgi:hypothetical protein
MTILSMCISDKDEQLWLSMFLVLVAIIEFPFFTSLIMHDAFTMGRRHRCSMRNSRVRKANQN